MNIHSVIPQNNNAPTCTIIYAQDSDGRTIPYAYSHAYELLHDPNAPYSWLGWNGGTLTEAIQYVISLPTAKEVEERVEAMEQWSHGEGY